jgi:hypothetical protein
MGEMFLKNVITAYPVYIKWLVKFLTIVDLNSDQYVRVVKHNLFDTLCAAMISVHQSE